MRRELKKQREADNLQEAVDEARNLAHKAGLEPYDVKYWVVDHEEMNELIAYGGFQRRYPHWRWGMKYDRQRKKSRIGAGKAFEIVNNDDPSNAFLQVSNTLSDQKAVITHVEAHADYFANNEWFGMFTDGELDASTMLARHAETIDDYMSDPDIDQEEVEKWIDACRTIVDNIDQHTPYTDDPEEVDGDELADVEDAVESLNVTEEVKNQIFDDEWMESQKEDEENHYLANPEEDLLQFLIDHGKQYDSETDRAIEMEDWQKDILEMMRREAYYFAGQKMTKVCNEGWASYWESMMMAEENFASTDEFMLYSDHMSKVLGSPGLNPYKLGYELWQYVENVANRNEVLDKLLRIEGVTWRNLTDTVDADHVMELLKPDQLVDQIRDDQETLDRLESSVDDPRIDGDAVTLALDGEIDLEKYPWKVLTYEGMAERHYSLVKREHKSFLREVSKSTLEERARYIMDGNRYSSVEEAIDDVDRTAGWDKLHMSRASHNDITLIDEFLTDEFVEKNDYFTYEYSHDTGDYRATSTDVNDVKKKLLLQFTNFGKPTIKAYDDNYNNAGELLLGHQYNGVQLDMGQAESVLEYMFELWGRPVNLMTVIKDTDAAGGDSGRSPPRGADINEPSITESAERIRYDGNSYEFHPLSPDMKSYVEADEIDYSTKPDEWL